MFCHSACLKISVRASRHTLFPFPFFLFGCAIGMDLGQNKENEGSIQGMYWYTTRGDVHQRDETRWTKRKVIKITHTHTQCLSEHSISPEERMTGLDAYWLPYWEEGITMISHITTECVSGTMWTKKKKERERESQRRCASWQREIHGLSVALAKYPWTEAHNTVHPHPPFFLSQILNSYFFFRSQCSGSRLGFSSPRVFLRALWISGVGFVSGVTVSTLDVCGFSTLARSH